MPSLYDRHGILLGFLGNNMGRGGGGGKKLDNFLLYPFNSLSISLRRLNMIEILFADPFYIQLTYRH